ncbi:DciA family protein [Pelagibacteraceae bacterium]|nr:DciA family protein [Pelagibacteraceae bacterium]
MHYKQNNKESKTYVQGLRPFGNTLPRGIKGILKKNGYNYSEIINKWNMMVGKEISSCSYPQSIKMKKGSSQKTLILAIQRGDEINIEYSKHDIINKVNSYFGYKLISEIKIKTVNSELKKKSTNGLINFSKNFEKKINTIKNTSIRNSLFKLIKTIQND